MSVKTRPIRYMVLLAASFAAACSGERNTGPRDIATFDAVRAQADARAMQALFGVSALQSFMVMSERFNVGPSVSASVVSAHEFLAAVPSLSAAESRRAAASLADRLISSVALNGSTGSPTLPPEALGKTFVFDPAEGRYIVAPERTGAPHNGVRFILYAVNPVSHQPIVETEIGYADLIDAGAASPSGIALKLIVVSGGLVYLDYTVAIQGSESSGSLAVTGFLTDGATRLNFDIEAHGTRAAGGGTLAIAFHFTVPERGFEVLGEVDGADTGAGASQRIDVLVRSGTDRIRFVISGDEHTINATVFANERIFATITGDHRNPEVRGADGRPLSTDEVAALQKMLELFGGVFELFGNLLKPVAVILALSTIP